MKNYKVKYNRYEYRNEYLKSDEWKQLSSQILDLKPQCQVCQNREASEVHHMVYRNLVDIKMSDLLPVCRKCHDFIHQAINDEYISQDYQKIDEIRERTLNILNDKEYEQYHKWLGSKHYLSDELIDQIKNLQPFVIKKISGMCRRNVWFTNLHEIKFTGRQIKNIEKIIQVAVYRKRYKLDSKYKKHNRKRW